MVVHLAVPFEKIRRLGGSALTDEPINLLHQERLDLFVFKQMIKAGGDCQVISQDVIGQ